MIRTRRLRLIPAELGHFDAVRQGDDALAGRLAVPIAAEWVEPEHREAIASGGERLAAEPAIGRWWTYFFLHDTGGLIGAGGFKGPPEDGAVEIGYGLAPAWRGQGLALEAARGLVLFGLADARVSVVRAHTLPEVNASTRLLAALGMRHVESLEDPEDGLVWRWAVTHSEAVG